MRTAKEYLYDLLADENLLNVGLEEVDFDGMAWRITIGFSRPWDHSGPLVTALADGSKLRSYKVLRISDETGTVESLKDRSLPTPP